MPCWAVPYNSGHTRPDAATFEGIAMRLFLSRALCMTVLFVPTLAALLRGETSKDPEAERIAGLIRKLGSDHFAQRHQASLELLKLGDKALPALQKAVDASVDTEVRRRAEGLVDTLMPRKQKSASIDLEMILIPKGDFMMGSPGNERNRRADESQHPVRISKPFYLGKFEVTQYQYREVIGTNPSSFAEGLENKDKPGGFIPPGFPVESVSWFDALDFCNRLSKKDGHAPYYKLEDVKRREKGSISSAKVTILGGNGYRLPTEAEWEYACREWSGSPYHFGMQNSGREANVKPGVIAGGYGSVPSWRANDRTTRVGSYPANQWKLHDMHGNVAEWCADWYDADYYANSPARNPNGPNTGTHRVVRGGSWLVNEGNCRTASRFFLPPGDAAYHCGFRVARNP
jgi:formylglycine-generating enzyme required for sulfatase activity